MLTRTQFKSALCACSLLLPSAVFATSVWENNYVTPTGEPVNLYLVTSFDQATDAGSGQVLDFYFDFLNPWDSAPDIDPASLLTSPSVSLATNSQLDIYHVINPVYPLGDASLQPITNGTFYPDPIVAGYGQNALAGGLGGALVNVDRLFADFNSGYAPDPGFYFGMEAQADGFTRVATSIVPIPAAVWLFGSGLIGLIGIARRKN